jgi:hypothetical protein
LVFGVSVPTFKLDLRLAWRITHYRPGRLSRKANRDKFPMRSRFERTAAASFGPVWGCETIRLTYYFEHTYTPDFIERHAKVNWGTKSQYPAEDRRKLARERQLQIGGCPIIIAISFR